MNDAAHPETLADLLRTLERSNDLRTLARECGLSVRELRRRLAIWRREVQADDEEAPGRAVPAPAPVPAAAAPAGDWPDLPAAATVAADPLPDPDAVLEIHTDGASRGNPGPAAVGIVFGVRGGPALCVHSEAIGRATNNVAEYRAAVIALEHCRRWGVRRVHLVMDSELIVRQLHGAYRVKSPDLRPLYQQVVFLSRGLQEFRVRHVKREHNAHADAVANRALDA
ncbi:MAG: ribonuclease HI family protein [Candidatus Krumholzibacteriia bacterium]